MPYKFKRHDLVIADDGNKGKVAVLTERNMLPFYYVELKGKMQHGYYENELRKDEAKDI